MKSILAVLALLMALSTTGFAQVKIGYTNIELVLAYMPEAKQVEQTLATYQKKLAEKLQIKQQFAQTKLQEYMELREANKLSPTEDESRQKELQQLDQEIQKEAADAEQKLMQKREELLLPVLEKLQNKIDEVAKSNGFTYILNQTTSTGVSTILFGPEENDITEKLMTALGIQIPKGNE
ncbi:MAG: OmpH family outer membrane protein [Bacteroidia bacterium]|nr:OmpH family outer membrane protein [Bacteroidia bacterium]